MLEGRDLAGPLGRVPLAGRVRRLEDVAVRLVTPEGWTKLYLRFGRLVRRHDKPVVDRVSGALFDPPQEGLPRLRLTLEAEEASADLAALAAGKESSARPAHLTGVVVRDPQGRELMRVGSLELDLASHRARTDVLVEVHLPRSGLVLRGRGLDAALDLRRTTLLREVECRLPLGKATLVLKAPGPASLEEVRDTEEQGRAGPRRFRVEVEGPVELEHPLGRMTGARLVLRATAPGGGAVRLETAHLAGPVRMEPAVGAAGGLRRLEAAAVVAKGPTTLLFQGPVRGLWEGKLAPLGLGRHRVGIRAGALRLNLDDRGGRLQRAYFTDGLAAEEVQGAGHLRTRELIYTPGAGRLRLLGAVDLSSPEGTLAAARVGVRTAGEDRLSLDIDGLEELTYVADGRLDPLGEALRGRLHLRCSGPVRVERKGAEIRTSAAGAVRAYLDERTGFEAGGAELLLREGRLVFLAARGGVTLRSAGREARGSSLAVFLDEAELRGTPARLAGAGGGSITAAVIQYDGGGHFLARGDVDLRRGLATEQPPADRRWRLRAQRLEGRLAPGGGLIEVEAHGGFLADGPQGERISGDRFTYDAATGEASLVGRPARLQRAKEAALEALRLDLRIEKGVLAAAATPGPAHVRYRAAEPGGFGRWEIDLDGPAELEGGTLRVPGGARLAAFGEQGKRVLEARAGRVLVTFEKTDGKAVKVRNLRGLDGVTVTTLGPKAVRIDAGELRYRPGERRVHVFGNARVAAKGWPREARFEHLVFKLTAHGVDLLEGRGIEVRREPGAGR